MEQKWSGVARKIFGGRHRGHVAAAHQRSAQPVAANVSAGERNKPVRVPGEEERPGHSVRGHGRDAHHASHDGPKAPQPRHLLSQAAPQSAAETTGLHLPCARNSPLDDPQQLARCH